MNIKPKHLLAIGLMVTATGVAGCFNGQGALNVAQAQQTGAVSKAQLNDKLKEAGEFAEEKYSFASWGALRAAMKDARAVAANKDARPEELQTAWADVQLKIQGLQPRVAAPWNGPRLALSAWPFATSENGALNNIKLMWASADLYDSVELQRAPAKSNVFQTIYTGDDGSFEDNGLPNGAYNYRLIVKRDNQTMVSNLAPVATLPKPVGARQVSNETGVGPSLWEPIQVGKTYYRFPGKRDGATMSYTMQTSTDGVNWTDGPVVLDKNSAPELDDYKLEANSIFYDKKRDKIIWWGHYERSKGYGSGRALVATATPGQPFTVHRIFNPMGVEVRDMSVFIDDDGQGYLVAASNVAGQGANATLYIFKMNDDLTDVTQITNKAMENGYREAPHILHIDGVYYLFFSQAAGWYPSRAAYVSAPTLDGTWSEPRELGNSSTFSAQSGGIGDYGTGNGQVHFMSANRWIRGEGTSGNVILPLKFAQGFVFTDYSPTLLVDASKNLMSPLHEGILLSQNQPATASVEGTKDQDVSKAFDGDYATAFVAAQKQWPFSVTSDLGAPAKIRNVQISWQIHKGSEAYYKYTIEGSMDGQNWNVLLDRTDDKDTVVSKTYGFSSDVLPLAPTARYVRINVQNAVLQNNPNNNWYTPTIYEIKVFGDR